MPTQSGIHQFRGKYGTTCYYFTKGKQNGLQRGINQQMSERVKRDPAFANTRLYAREFGYCARLAALSFVPNEFGLTINLRANSQGRLTKIYRNLLNEYSFGGFGHRYFNWLAWQDHFVAQINDMCRIDADLIYPISHSVSLFPTGRDHQYDVVWHIQWNSTLVDSMVKNNLKSLWLRLRHFTLCAGHYNADAGAYVDIAREVAGYSADYQLPIEYAQTHNEYNVILHGAFIYHPTDEASSAADANSRLSRPIVAVEGYRNVGGVDFKQQSLCGYKMLDNPKIINASISKINYMGVDYLPNTPGPDIDGGDGAPILAYSGFISQFDSPDGFSARINYTNSRVIAIENGYAVCSVPADLELQKVRDFYLTFPNGISKHITFTA